MEIDGSQWDSQGERTVKDLRSGTLCSSVKRLDCIPSISVSKMRALSHTGKDIN